MKKRCPTKQLEDWKIDLAFGRNANGTWGRCKGERVWELGGSSGLAPESTELSCLNGLNRNVRNVVCLKKAGAHSDLSLSCGLIPCGSLKKPRVFGRSLYPQSLLVAVQVVYECVCVR